MTLRFHWRMPLTGEESSTPQSGAPDLDELTRFCVAAEEAGIESVLSDFGWGKPDPMTLSCALGARTTHLRFMMGWRSGLLSPSLFVQQLNTMSALIGGHRIALNIVGGHSPGEHRGYGDFLLHDERYARTDEFLAICNAYWNGEQPLEFRGKYYTIEQGKVKAPFVARDGARAPERYIAGNSAQARELAVRQGSCSMMMVEPPHVMRELAAPMLAAGKTAGVRVAVIARETRGEALEAARALVESAGDDHQKEWGFVAKSDSPTQHSRFDAAMSGEEWITPTLWHGAMKTHGPASAALVGSFDEIAAALLEYGDVGVTQFILSGWPKLDEMLLFGAEVIPRVRRSEELRARRDGTTG